MRNDELYDKLIEKRIVLIDGKIDNHMAIRVKGSIVALNLISTEEIKLVIDSGGGMVISAFGIFNVIKCSGAKIAGIVTGVCDSCAMFIFQACHTRQALAHSTFLLHYVESDFEFNASEDPKDLYRRFRLRIKSNLSRQKSIEEVIVARSGLSIKKVRELMTNGEKHRIRLTAEEARSLNLIDNIYTGAIL